MATTPSTPSTYVDIDAPSISTPIWPHPVQTQTLSGLPPHDPTMYNISTPHGFAYPGTRVRLLSPVLAGSASVQPLTWPSHQDSMQICTSMDATSPSMARHDLPGILPTPGRGIQQMNAHVQGNWDNLMESMKRQEKTVNELTKVLKTSSSHHEKQITDLATKVESSNQQVVTLMTALKQQEAAESDQLIKAVQLMITKEIKKMELTFTSVVQDKVEQLRMEVQQDIKTVQRALQSSLDQVTTDLQQCETQIDKCHTCVAELQNDFQVYNKQNAEPQTANAPPVSSTHPVETVANPLPVPLIKSDHIKLTFPTFGRPIDDTDPLLYLTKCQDFLALHPLPDTDLLATFRTVLHGTARDWWEVSRSNITTWKEFETAFLSAFLSEDYEDELAERNCPVYPPSQQSSGQQHFTHTKYSHHSAKSGGRPSNNNVAASETPQVQTEIQMISTSSSPTATMTIPQQLVVPIRIASWSGKAIVDTGSSYTLIHEANGNLFSAPALVMWTSVSGEWKSRESFRMDKH
ncbi:hypothetical protein QQF64_007578 [Cirrhinus molitorella]|uniref:Retrotransposon gag domain-containing protein n=1 Tax=Cirrhinus molitorella TaxID=172907 RepID=A0ABR3MB71_9TELE